MMSAEKGEAINSKSQIVFKFSTYEEIKYTIAVHQKMTGSQFSVYKISPKNFGSSELSTKKRVYFKDTTCEQWSLPDDSGIPFMTLGWVIYDCVYGRDRKIAAKQKRDQKIIESGSSRVRTNQQNKKRNCPAQIAVREVAKFPDYQAAPDTSVKRRSYLAQKIKSAILRKDVKFSREFFLFIPDISQHRYHSLTTCTEMPKEDSSEDAGKCKALSKLCRRYCNGIMGLTRQIDNSQALEHLKYELGHTLHHHKKFAQICLPEKATKPKKRKCRSACNDSRIKKTKESEMRSDILGIDHVENIMKDQLLTGKPASQLSPIMNSHPLNKSRLIMSDEEAIPNSAKDEVEVAHPSSSDETAIDEHLLNCADESQFEIDLLSDVDLSNVSISHPGELLVDGDSNESDNEMLNKCANDDEGYMARRATEGDKSVEPLDQQHCDDPSDIQVNDDAVNEQEIEVGNEQEAIVTGAEELEFDRRASESASSACLVEHYNSLHNSNNTDSSASSLVPNTSAYSRNVQTLSDHSIKQVMLPSTTDISGMLLSDSRSQTPVQSHSINYLDIPEKISPIKSIPVAEPQLLPRPRESASYSERLLNSQAEEPSSFPERTYNVGSIHIQPPLVPATSLFQSFPDAPLIPSDTSTSLSPSSERISLVNHLPLASTYLPVGSDYPSSLFGHFRSQHITDSLLTEAPAKHPSGSLADTLLPESRNKYLEASRSEPDCRGVKHCDPLASSSIFRNSGSTYSSSSIYGLRYPRLGETSMISSLYSSDILRNLGLPSSYPLSLPQEPYQQLPRFHDFIDTRCSAADTSGVCGTVVGPQCPPSLGYLGNLSEQNKILPDVSHPCNSSYSFLGCHPLSKIHQGRSLDYPSLPAQPSFHIYPPGLPLPAQSFLYSLPAPIAREKPFQSHSLSDGTFLSNLEK